MCLIIISHIAHTLLIFRFTGLHSLRWYLSLSTSIDNRLNLLYIYITFIHTTALLIDLHSLHMSALCHVIPYLYYSALISLYLFSLFSSYAFSLLCLTDFKICLLEHLYHKDCITTRQSWLFSFYIVANNIQDEMKLENIYRANYSLLSFYYNSFIYPFYITQHPFSF